MLEHIAKSIKRGLSRILILSCTGIVLLLLSDFIPKVLGTIGSPLAFGFGLAFLGLAVGDLSLRILQPKIDPQKAAIDAMEKESIGAGLVYLGRCIIAAVILLLIVTASRAGTVDTSPPPNAVKYLPVLKAQQVAYWKDMSMPDTLGAQVEQETCYSLKSPGCWNPNTQLKTSREQGVGLGQITRTFSVSGAVDMDALADLKRSFPAQLAGFSWDNPFNPTLQLRALILKDYQGYKLILGTDTDYDRIAMTYAAYNGGSGGLNSDRRVCAATDGCNTGKWFGNVALTSLKSHTSIPGYGQSFFETNRTYVKNIMVVRRIRYASLDSALSVDPIIVKPVVPEVDPVKPLSYWCSILPSVC